jgi:DNA-binding MarR family transcriptional regulator
VDELLVHVVNRFPWADPAAVELGYRVGAASAAARASVRRLLKSMGYERAAGKIGVLRSLYFALDQQMSQQAISENMNVTSGNVTYLVDGLLKDGLVERSPHPSDRRGALVRLTPKGCEAFESIAPALVRLQVSYAENFTPEERAQFANYLMRFRDNAAKFNPAKPQLGE